MYDPSKEKQIVIVDKAEVRTYWHLVEPSLIRMQQEKQSADKWIIPEVYASIVGGGSTLAFTVVSKEPGLMYKDRDTALKSATGFMVLQQVKGYADTNMHIWIASRIDSDDPKATASMIFSFNQEMDEMAKSNNYDNITFHSNRDFWLKLAPRLGFEVGSTRWVRGVK